MPRPHCVEAAEVRRSAFKALNWRGMTLETSRRVQLLCMRIIKCSPLGMATVHRLKFAQCPHHVNSKRVICWQ